MKLELTTEGTHIARFDSMSEGKLYEPEQFPAAFRRYPLSHRQV